MWKQNTIHMSLGDIMQRLSSIIYYIIVHINKYMYYTYIVFIRYVSACGRGYG